MKTFIVYRIEDVSGVSGTGVIAEGVEFHDKQVAVSWFGKHQIVEVCRDIETWLAVHGHAGKTRLDWYELLEVPETPQAGAPVVSEPDNSSLQNVLPPNKGE